MARGTYREGEQANSGFILPDSNALKGLMDNIEQNRKMGLLNIKAKQAYNDQLNKDFMDNQLKVKSGILFQDELNKATQDWANTGAQMRAKGINPFNPNSSNPAEVAQANAFLKQKAVIEGMANTRDIYQKNYLEQQNAYEKGGYDEDSYAALNDFYKNSKLSDLYTGGVLPPTLMKSFDAQGFLKNIKAPTIKSNVIKDGIETTTVAPNSAAIQDMVESSLSQNPQAQRWFNKQFRVDPKEAPAGTVIGNTDPAEIGSYLDQYYKSPEGAEKALKAFPSGVVPSYNSPEYKTMIQDAIKKQQQIEQRYNNGILTLAQQKENEVNTQDITKANFDQENQRMKREDQSMQRGRYAMAKTDFNNKQQDRKFKNDNLNKRDEFIQGLQVGNREQVQNLRQLVKSKGGNLAWNPDGSMRVTYNDKIDGQTRPVTQEFDLSEINDNGYVALNELLSKVTGKKVDIESLQAKPEYSGGLVDVGESSFTKSQIQEIQNQFKSPQDLGDFLIKLGGFKNRTDAYKTAAEILDKKGRYHIIQQKK